MPVIEEITGPGYEGTLNHTALQQSFRRLRHKYPDPTRRTTVFEQNMYTLERYLGEGHPKIKRMREEFYEFLHAQPA